MTGHNNNTSTQPSPHGTSPRVLCPHRIGRSHPNMVASGRSTKRSSHTDLSGLPDPQSAVPASPAAKPESVKKRKKSSSKEKRHGGYPRLAYMTRRGKSLRSLSARVRTTRFRISKSFHLRRCLEPRQLMSLMRIYLQAFLRGILKRPASKGLWPLSLTPKLMLFCLK